MTKLLFVSNDMNIGGIQKSLLVLLKELSKSEEYDISLFCCRREGVYIDEIPSTVKILDKNEYAEIPEMSASQCKKKGNKYYLYRMIFSLWSKLFSKKFPSFVLCRLIGKIKGEYDVAISYSQPIEEHSFSKLSNEIVQKCVKARKKVSFLHCDFSSYGGNTPVNRALYKKFDAIAAVSESVREKFCEIIPEAADKTFTVNNCCDCEQVRVMSNDNPVAYNRTAIVTVARLSAEKGLLRCVPVFSRLKTKGYDFEWHIIGNGPLNNELINEVNKYNLENNIILEGEQTNPYRFMKNADYFLLPSFHEAAPMVFDEAFALGIPVLTTKTLSAVELVENRKTGIVCDNDADSIYNMLEYALSGKGDFNITGAPENEACIKQFHLLCK